MFFWGPCTKPEGIDYRSQTPANFHSYPLWNIEWKNNFVFDNILFNDKKEYDQLKPNDYIPVFIFVKLFKFFLHQELA